ncbi:hypothetical protein [Dyadobacter sp. CY343]|uniref:hypothetical protein n=1 Tax=Dyadobacter sp. CY343 TaxID=2907299 RepID=UPI001F367213|nr:hypothetical protein [Dyadobacter sp. CY343]MCE7061949.1 hypothetical protein [Dyadobacter sp. CY343]
MEIFQHHVYILNWYQNHAITAQNNLLKILSEGVQNGQFEQVFDGPGIDIYRFLKGGEDGNTMMFTNRLGDYKLVATTEIPDIKLSQKIFFDGSKAE